MHGPAKYTEQEMEGWNTLLKQRCRDAEKYAIDCAADAADVAQAATNQTEQGRRWKPDTELEERIQLALAAAVSLINSLTPLAKALRVPLDPTAPEATERN